VRPSLLLLIAVVPLAACGVRVAWLDAGRAALRAVERADAVAMAQAVAALFARYNLAVRPPADIEALAVRERKALTALLGETTKPTAHSEQPLRQAIAPSNSVAETLAPLRGDVEALVLLRVAREIALRVAGEHLDLAHAPFEAAALADVHGAAALTELARENALSARLASVMRRLRRSSESAAHSRAVRELMRLERKPPPFLSVLAKVYPQAFDRTMTRVAFVYPNARLCTLRSVASPDTALAAVTPDGRMFLAEPRVLRELSAFSASERRFATTAPLGPGRITFVPSRAPARAEGHLVHVYTSPHSLEARRFVLRNGAAVLDASIEVRGGGFAPDVGAPDAQGGTVTLSRRMFPGVIEYALGFEPRQAKRVRILPGAVGHRDGPLGAARFWMGASATSPMGVRLFYDPAARALRVLVAAAVATIALAGHRDGKGAEAGVGEILSIAAGSDHTFFLAERRRAGGSKRHIQLRALDLSGKPCAQAPGTRP
jgi:hypothetical protein